MLRQAKALALLFALAGSFSVEAQSTTPASPRPRKSALVAKPPAPPGRESLTKAASAVCDAAPSQPPGNSAAIGPSLTVLKAEGGTEWTYSADLQVPKGTVEAAAVKTVLCIEEVFVNERGKKYEDGAEA
jgi:hypothetical protein